MSALSIQPPYPAFAGADGLPLENGYIWIGTANLNPITNPISVYWDAALTVAAVQPIRTLAGYPANSGTPARLYVNSDYSIQVQNKNGSVVYSAPAATERYNEVVLSSINAIDVNYDPSGTGAVPTNVQSKLREVVSAFDFMTSAEIADVQARTASINVAPAINAALATGRSVHLPSGKYLVNSSLQITNDGQHLYGDGNFGQTVILWGGTTNDSIIENNNSTRRFQICLQDFRIEYVSDGVVGVDFSNWSYSSMMRIEIDGYGSNTVGVLMQGNALGDRPYYNHFTKVDCASNNIGGVTTGSIGWYLKRAVTFDAFNFNGPNANQWTGGRVSGYDKAFYCEDAIGNTFTGVVSESILTSHFEFGVPNPIYPTSGGAAVFSATVNTLTDNSSLVCNANQLVNATIYILTGPGAGQYRQVLTNGVNGSPFTVYPYWNIVPTSASTYQIFNEAGSGNTLMGCYAEGDATSSPDWLKINPGPISTYAYGGSLGSLGILVNDIAPKVQNHFNPNGYGDAFPITFALENVGAGITDSPLSPVGWLRNNFSIPGFWHVQSVDIACAGNITSGTAQLWVTSNSSKINVSPDVTLTSTSTFPSGGGSVAQRLFSTTSIAGSSLQSQIGVLVTTDGGFLPAGTLDLYVTLYVVPHN